MNLRRCPTVVYRHSIVMPGTTLRDAPLVMVGYRRPMAIDREWDEPVYRQVAAILRGQIESGEIEPRRPIPSVRTLCQRDRIAPATAQNAVALLRDQGLPPPL